MMFGLGGVFVEVLKDVAFAMALLTAETARRPILGEGRGLAARRARTPARGPGCAHRCAWSRCPGFAAAAGWSEIASVAINLHRAKGGVGAAVILRS